MSSISYRSSQEEDSKSALNEKKQNKPNRPNNKPNKPNNRPNNSNKPAHSGSFYNQNLIQIKFSALNTWILPTLGLNSAQLLQYGVTPAQVISVFYLIS